MLKPRKFRSLAALVLAVSASLSLSACGMFDRFGEVPEGAKPVTKSSASKDKTADIPCTDLNVEKMKELYSADFPRDFKQTGKKWDLEHLDDKNYANCKPISFVAARTVGDTDKTGPVLVLFFHEGKYLAGQDRVFYVDPVIEKPDENTLVITHRKVKDGEDATKIVERQKSTYKWGPINKQIEQTSSVPAPNAKTILTPVNIPGVFPGAGGSLPEGATEVTTLAQNPDQAVPAEKQPVVLVSPSKNIVCEIMNQDGGIGGCSVKSWFKDKKFGADANGEKIYIPFNAGAAPIIEGVKNQPAGWYYQPQVELPYGKAVYYKDIACGSAENGMTCWNYKTGHGVFVSRDEYKAF